MAGYSWENGKSNAAVAAEADGLMVASKLAKWVSRWRRFRGCTAADVAAVLGAAEWHHSSKFFNCVKYYNPLDLWEADCRQELAERIADRKRYAKMYRQIQQQYDGYLWMRDPDTEEVRRWYTLDTAVCAMNLRRAAAQLEFGYVPQQKS